MYQCANGCCGALGALGTDAAACSALTLGAQVGATGISGLASSNIGFTPLTSGRYSLNISGNVVSFPRTAYGGQLTMRNVPAPANVPEPASLALFALGLCGLGATLRKRKSA